MFKPNEHLKNVFAENENYHYLVSQFILHCIIFIILNFLKQTRHSKLCSSEMSGKITSFENRKQLLINCSLVLFFKNGF